MFTLTFCIILSKLTVVLLGPDMQGLSNNVPSPVLGTPSDKSIEGASEYSSFVLPITILINFLIL